MQISARIGAGLLRGTRCEQTREEVNRLNGGKHA